MSRTACGWGARAPGAPQQTDNDDHDRPARARPIIERRPDPRGARASLIFLTPRSRRFRPVAAATLLELDKLVRRRLSAPRLAELKDALRQLMELD
jgi:hypothetical protein